MPTKDEFISVPLESSLNLKESEFVAQAPTVRQSDNVDHESTAGNGGPLPPMNALPALPAGADARSMVVGNGSLAVMRDDGRPVLYNRSTQAWEEDKVSTNVLASTVTGGVVFSAQNPVERVSSGKNDLFEVFAWTENAEPDVLPAVDGKGYYVVRDKQRTIGPVEIFSPSGGNQQRIMDVCVVAGPAGTPGPTRAWVWFTYRKSNGTSYSLSVIEVFGDATQSFTPFGDDDSKIVEASRVDAIGNALQEDYHHVVAGDGRYYAVNLGSGARDADLDLDGTETGLRSVAITRDQGAGGSGTVHVAATGGAGAPSDVFTWSWDGYAGVQTKSSASLPQEADTEFEEVTVCISRGNMLGMAGRRNRGITTDNQFDSVFPFWKVADALTSTIFNLNERNHMRLIGDAYIDADDNAIFPLTFRPQLPNTPYEEYLVYPVDPAVVGYMFEPRRSFNSETYWSLHPVARWGVDIVRSNWGRSKSSLPFTGLPTSAKQGWGPTILDVEVVPRTGSTDLDVFDGPSVVDGPIVNIFDGRFFLPACFLWRPGTCETSVQGGQGTTPVGTIGFRAVLVWQDSSGQRIRSAAGPAHFQTFIGQESVGIRCSHYELSHPTDTEFRLARCWFYTTEVDGDQFYLLTDDNGNPVEDHEVFADGDNWFFTGYLDNPEGNPENAPLSFVNTPPEVSPHGPPAFFDQEIIRDRVWGIDATNRLRIWYSKIIQPGIAPEFSAEQVINMPAEDGALTAIGVASSYIVFFKRNSVWAIQGGTGPANTIGFGQPFPQPLLLARTGCASRNSVVNFPGGLVFWTGRAFSLLTNGLQVQTFGLEVQPTVTGSVASARHISARRELHFQTSDADGAESHYVYNYDVKAWSRWTDFSFIDSVDFPASTAFLTGDLDPPAIQTTVSPASPVLGSPQAVPPRTVTTQYIRPGDRHAARRMREVLLEFEVLDDIQAGDDITATVREEHNGNETVRLWTGTEILAAYPTAGPSGVRRIILRVVTVDQFESAQLTVEVLGVSLGPVSASFLFGVEQGVQRRMPEGTSK